MRDLLRRTSVGTVALMGAFMAGGARPAHAIFADVATSGTIDSGTDSSGLFGAAGASLAGRAYTLDLVFDAPGSFTYASATDATTSGTSTGSVTLRIGGVTFTTGFIGSYGSYLEQTPHEITAANIGDEMGGNFLSVSNSFSTVTALLPVNLYAPFTYMGTAADLGANAGSPVTFSLSGASENVSFAATPGSVSYTVPEPASFGLLAGGVSLAGLMRRRKRQARRAPGVAGTRGGEMLP